MKKIISYLLIHLSLVGNAFGYDLSQEKTKESRKGPITVALVPYTDQQSSSLTGIMNRMEKELGRSRGIRVLDRSKTDSILRYYLKYVNKNSGDTGVEEPLARAREAIIAGNYAEAVKGLDLTEKKIQERVSKGGTNEGLYQIYILRAKVYHATDKETLVRKEYEKLFLLNPYLEFDPNLYSKWECAALRSVKERFAGQSSGSVEVASSPQGSEVFLNGIHAGITPMTLKDLPPATHIIEVKSVNHDPFLERVVLPQGEVRQVNAKLARYGVASEDRGETIRPSLYRTESEVSRLISTLGYHLGVDKVVLVADKEESGNDSVVYRLGDTNLGAVQKQHEIPISSGEPRQGIALLVNSISEEARADLLKNPAKYADQTVGSVKLHEKRKNPLYKRPLFWVLVAAGAGTGGALGAILGGTTAAATAGGVVIGL